MPKNSNHRKKEPVYIGKHLEINPRVCGGKLIFRGTRVPVRVILAYIVQGMSVEEATQEWPTVSREAILEALSLASETFLSEYDSGRKRAA